MNKRALGFGLVAGAICAAIWAAVGLLANIELGILALGVGFLVGTAVAYGTDHRGDISTGVMAAVIAVLAVCGGKWAMIHFTAERELDKLNSQLVGTMSEDEVFASYVAGDLVAADEAKGVSVTWPEGIVPNEALGAAQFPAGYWDKAVAATSGLSAVDARNLKEDVAERLIASASGDLAEAKMNAFVETFGLMDILFLGMALFYAYSIAATNRDEEMLAAQAGFDELPDDTPSGKFDAEAMLDAKYNRKGNSPADPEPPA